MRAKLRALEFYSGIGGMHYALRQAFPDAQVVSAFEINELANDVYQANFGARPVQGNIGALTAKHLDRLAADLWLLAPPCQPYTRRGLKLDSQDPRAASFLHLLSLIKLMQCPPSLMLIENVVGFETSDTRQILASTLSSNNMQLQEFVLSPLQVGIPYSRPRYFALVHRVGDHIAPRQPDHHHATVADADDTPVPARTPHGTHAACAQGLGSEDCSDTDSAQAQACGAQPASASAEGIGGRVTTPCLLPPRQLRGMPAAQIAPISNFLHDAITADHARCGAFAVPKEVIFHSGRVFDIVTADSKRCNCFTRTYGQYAKGSGSVLATEQLHRLRTRNARPDNRASLNEPRADRVDVIEELDVQLEESMLTLGLRYFSPREIANLHSFPKSLIFPAHISIRQQYALLGNSLSVELVAELLHHLVSLVSMPTP